MGGIKWSKTPEQAYKELYDEYAETIEKEVMRIITRYKGEIENHMKAEAPWTDRSGNARQALWADIEHKVRVMITVTFGHSHGIEYGVYLEFANAGKYAIVNPTFDIFAPRIWADIERMLK